MSSSLRFSVSASSSSQPIPLIQKTISSPPSKKQKMSLTQTYYLAHTARGKLSKEASRSDHNLRRLVGHANLLDGLMLDLADAEREQESWFNNTVRGAAKASEEPKHIQWAETIEESMDEDDESDTESLDSDSDSDDEEIHYAKNVPFHRRSSQPATTITAMELDDTDMEDDEDYEDDLVLTRTSSHPPELLHESDSESEDDSMPPSPPQPEIQLDAFSEKQREAIATTSFYQSMPDDSTSSAALPPSEQASFFDEGFYLPQRQQTTIISSYWVYSCEVRSGWWLDLRERLSDWYPG